MRPINTHPSDRFYVRQLGYTGQMWRQPDNSDGSQGLATRKPGWRFVFPFLPALLALLIVISLAWLPWKAQRLESAERQEQLIADTLWVEQSVRLQLAQDEEWLRQVAAEIATGRLVPIDLKKRAAQLLARREVVRLLWLDAHGGVLAGTDRSLPDSASNLAPLSDASLAAADGARRTARARYAAPTRPGGRQTPMQMDYHLPLLQAGHYQGSLVATYATAAILEQMVPWWFAQDNEIMLTGADDSIIERRAAGGPGRGIYTHVHALDLPGANLTLRTNSLKTLPKLLPNLLVGAVIALTLGLLASLLALWRDINRRLQVEGALRQQVSFRTAMENSLVTGLRARDLEGRVTYVNPAFCKMVGTDAADLVGRMPPMPYWAPEAMAEYQKRFAEVLAGTVTPQGFETIFQRAGGIRFPVLIFESPLLDAAGRQTGWMGSILDISDSKRIEDLNRQQQEKLESNARLASMGEIASTLAHELNQPLAAISSYTTGALNLLNGCARTGVAPDAADLRLALERASSQAQRAGQIIRSVHAFVKQHEASREPVAVRGLIDGIVPLVELQAHKFFVVLHVSIAPGLPPVLADRVLIEQVLLNLTRNAIESMEDIAPAQRILQITASRDGEAVNAGGGASDADSASSERMDGHDGAGVRIAIIDRGQGIAASVGERLFSPFFSTKAEGMGMGLNICRTAVEFHGGRLAYCDNPGGGTIFSFSLPLAATAAPTDAAQSAAAGGSRLAPCASAQDMAAAMSAAPPGVNRIA